MSFSTTGLLNTMHLTTMQLIFGPRRFNILMCLANNWPPQYYAPHYYATDLWSKEWIFNILMCPLATTGLLNTMHSLIN
jgi:hypothetical protein